MLMHLFVGQVIFLNVFIANTESNKLNVENVDHSHENQYSLAN